MAEWRESGEWPGAGRVHRARASARPSSANHGEYNARFAGGHSDTGHAYDAAARARATAGHRPHSAYREHDESWFDRASNEVASWFGPVPETEGGSGPHAGRGPRGYVRPDERIGEDLNERLTRDARVDATNIEVIVHDREVTLNGTVVDRSEKHRSERLAEEIPGVIHVQNNLRVEPGGRSEYGGRTPSPEEVSARVIGAPEDGASRVPGAPRRSGAKP